MFGIEPKVGLASTVIPPNMLGNIRTEEHLDTILQNEAEGGGLMKRNKKERRNRKEKRNMMEKRHRNSLKLGNWLQPAKKKPHLE